MIKQEIKDCFEYEYKEKVLNIEKVILEDAYYDIYEITLRDGVVPARVQEDISQEIIKENEDSFNYWVRHGNFYLWGQKNE